MPEAFGLFYWKSQRRKTEGPLGVSVFRSPAKGLRYRSTHATDCKYMTAKRGLVSICTTDTTDGWGFSWYNGPSTKGATALKVAAKMALRGERQLTKYSWEATRLPYCDAPVEVVFQKPAADAGPPVRAVIFAPCRKCDKCQTFRQMRLRERVMTELQATSDNGRRSWWITLTFAPVHLAGVLAEASASGRPDARGVERAAYGHVQKYLKRLRKAAKARFLYFAVYERGEENGRSHYHMIIHETGGNPVLKSTIEKQWRSITHARLVHMGDARSQGLASYLTKYATKTLGVPVRMSNGYGTGRRHAVVARRANPA